MANRHGLPFVLLSLTAVMAASAQTPPPAVQTWTGWAQCQIAIEAPGYSHGETHRWEITGAGKRQSNVEIYPAAWTVTGAGSLQRRGRTLVPERWSGTATLTNVEIGFTRHLDRITFQRWSGAGPARGAFTGSETRPSMDVQQWAFPAGQDALTSTRITGSTTSNFNGAIGPLAPADAKGTATCTWDFGPAGAVRAPGGRLETSPLPSVSVDLVAGLPAPSISGPNPFVANGVARFRFWLTHPLAEVLEGAVVRLPASPGLSKTRVTCILWNDPGAPCLAGVDVPVAQAESGFAIPTWYPGFAAMIEVTATVAPGSTTVNATATVTAPAGGTDPNPGNNSYTLSFTAGVADTQIAITATDPAATNPLVPVVSRPAGGKAHYLVQISNHGPSAADGAVVTIPSATGVSSPTYVCSGPHGQQQASSAPAFLPGRFEIPSLPAGSWVNCTIAMNVTGAVGGWATLTVAVAAPGWIQDPTPGNNTATNTLPIK